MFDSQKGGCTASWDMNGRGCKMVGEGTAIKDLSYRNGTRSLIHSSTSKFISDSNTVAHGGRSKTDSSVDQVERDETPVRAQARSPYGNILFSPQHVHPPVLVPFANLHASSVVPIHDTDAVIVNKNAASDSGSKHGSVASKAGPLHTIQKRWASNELDQDDNFLCPKPNGLFSHDSDCSAFWNCGDGVAYLQNCPPPLMFDLQQQVPLFVRKYMSFICLFIVIIILN